MIQYVRGFPGYRRAGVYWIPRLEPVISEPGGLENEPVAAYIQGMVVNALKLAAVAGLFLVTAGVWRDWRKSAALAIGTCIAAALVLHVVAP